MVAGTLNRKRKSQKKSLWRIDDMVPTEMMAFCPNCKALEVVRFEGVSMVPTRKFTQRAGKIYHSCNSKSPCRLHRFGGSAGLPSTAPRLVSGSHHRTNYRKSNRALATTRAK